MSSLAHCPIEGCTVYGGERWMRLHHAPLLHIRCACGWVGVGRNFKQHVAQCRRFGIAGPHHPLGAASP